MKKIIVSTALLVIAATASAAEKKLTDMIGKWKWEGFTVVVKKCPKTEICAKVVAGPKNVGLEMIRSKLTLKGDHYTGKIAHPQTGDVYNTKLKMTDANTWHLDGCTDKNVCASGNFTRVK